MDGSIISSLALASIASIPRPFPSTEFDPAIAMAADQAGIFSDALDHSWIDDNRLKKGLLLAFEAHDGKHRRYGTKVRGVHEVWVAHRVFNDPHIQEWLAKQKLSPLLGAYCAVIHDTVENFRSLAEERNEIFDPAVVVRLACAIWGNPGNNVQIERFLAFATDLPGLHGKQRHAAQRDKSFDAIGRCTSNPLYQGVRLYDKLSHVVLDAIECLRGNLSPRNASICFIQAVRKSFVLKFPVASAAIKQEYIDCLRRFIPYMNPGIRVQMLNLASLKPLLVARTPVIFKRGAFQITKRSTHSPSLSNGLKRPRYRRGFRPYKL